MGKKLIIAPSARRDLHHIVREIARDAPQRALTFGNALLDQATQASFFQSLVESCRNFAIVIFES